MVANQLDRFWNYDSLDRSVSEAACSDILQSFSKCNSFQFGAALKCVPAYFSNAARQNNLLDVAIQIASDIELCHSLWHYRCFNSVYLLDRLFSQFFSQHAFWVVIRRTRNFSIIRECVLSNVLNCIVNLNLLERNAVEAILSDAF